MRDDLVALFTVCFIKQSGTIVVGYYVAVNVAEVFVAVGSLLVQVRSVEWCWANGVCESQTQLAGLGMDKL